MSCKARAPETGSGWRTMESCPRTEDGKGRPVLVWHVYNECMVYNCEKARGNRFIIRWMEIPGRWIRIEEKTPTSRDANTLGVVIAQDVHGTVKLRGWRQTDRDNGIVRWMRAPEGPEKEK